MRRKCLPFFSGGIFWSFYSNNRKNKTQRTEMRRKQSGVDIVILGICSQHRKEQAPKEHYITKSLFISPSVSCRITQLFRYSKTSQAGQKYRLEIGKLAGLRGYLLLRNILYTDSQRGEIFLNKWAKCPKKGNKTTKIRKQNKESKTMTVTTSTKQQKFLSLQ